jgi:GxxExxY protein
MDFISHGGTVMLRDTETGVNEITSAVLGAAIRVHRSTGPGLLESTYQTMLIAALEHDGLTVERERPVHLTFEGMLIRNAYYVDLIVEQRVLVELKSVETLSAVHSKQVITYLKLTGLEAGLLINFNVPILKDGIKRFLNSPANSV